MPTARHAVDDLLTKISENKLVAQPGFQALRRELLGEAANYYRVFAGRRLNHPTIRADVIGARTRLGEIELAIGSPERAESEVRGAIAAAGPAPRPPGVEVALTEALVRLAAIERLRGLPAEALKTTDEALATIRALAPKARDVRARRSEADALVQRASILCALGRPGDAEADLRESIRLLDDLGRDRPVDREIARDRTQAAISLAYYLVRQSGRSEVALDALDDARSRCRAACEGPAAGLNDRADLASIEIIRANYVSMNLGRWDDARLSLENARTILERLTEENSLVVNYRLQLLNVNYTLGYIQLRNARYREAAVFYQKAADLVDRLIRDEPKGEGRYAIERGGILIELAEVRRHLGDPRGAAAILRDRCIPTTGAALDAAPKVVQLQLELAMAHRYLSQALLDGGDPKLAAEAARRGETILAPLVELSKVDALHREELARIRIAIADALRSGPTPPPDCEPTLDSAIAMLDDLLKVKADAPDRITALGYALARRSALRKLRGDTVGAVADACRGVGLIEPLAADDPDRLVHLAVARLADGQPSEKVLDALRRAEAAGLSNPASLRVDPDLALLRPLPAFAEILARVEARSAEGRR